MPNWSINEIEISGDELLLEKFNEDNTTLDDNGKITLSFNLSVPTPENLLSIDKVGEYGWYDWRIENWGTKWDASNAEPVFQNGNLYYFADTAWAPPTAWLEKVSAIYPELTFTVYYDEPGMCFAGKSVFINGEFQSDISWEGESQLFGSCAIKNCEMEVEEAGAAASERVDGKSKDFYCEEHKLEEAVIQAERESI